MNQSKLKAAYDKEYVYGRYARSGAETASEHHRFAQLSQFVERNHLQDKRCLEIGCGKGAFQDIVSDYIGIDIAELVSPFLHKPFLTASAIHLPFVSNYFDCIWSIDVLEHIPQPEMALAEMRRVLKPGGLLFLAPAWFCRPWAANGYAVRPYADLDWRGKLVKASIPVRNSMMYRLPGVLLHRAARLISQRLRPHPTRLYYTELTPNYEKNWTSDADAVNNIDPFDATLWFTSRGDECVTHPSTSSAFRMRTGALILRISKVES